MTSSDRPSTEIPARRRAVLYAVLYGELFEHALSCEEVMRYQPSIAGNGDGDGLATRADVEALVGEFLDGEVDDLLCWRGRDELLAERLRRRERSARLWPVAERYGRWLKRVPFVRMVAVCGSLAMDNAPEGGDVDIFIVAADGRLWIVHAFAMVLRRLVGRRGVKVCPNYLLSRGALEVGPKTLFTAREVVQAVPLWGGEVHREFLAANRWVASFLPGVDLGEERKAPVEGGETPAACRGAEVLLGGAVGRSLDRLVHRALLAYFTRRWRRHDPSGRGVREAYRRDRQKVVGGGYAAAVRGRFERLVKERVGESEVIAEDLERLFPPPQRSGAEPVPHFAELFDSHYGSSESTGSGDARGVIG